MKLRSKGAAELGEFRPASLRASAGCAAPRAAAPAAPHSKSIDEPDGSPGLGWLRPGSRSRAAATMLLASAARRTLSTAVKTRTNLVGLDVVPDALPVLGGLCKQQLSAVQVLPAQIPYRQDIEKFTNFLLTSIEGSKSVAEFEEKVGLGEIEEVIDMVKTEMELIPKYAEWRAWEEPTGAEKERLMQHKQLVLDSLKDRNAAVRRLDIPMREPSVDFPAALNVELKLPEPPAEEEKK